MKVYDFGLRLKELRENKKLSQTDVAKKLQLSRTTISAYEQNIQTPRIEVLIKLALLYGATTDYILGLEKRKTICLDDYSEKEIDALVDFLGSYKIMKNEK